MFPLELSVQATVFIIGNMRITISRGEYIPPLSHLPFQRNFNKGVYVWAEQVLYYIGHTWMLLFVYIFLIICWNLRMLMCCGAQKGLWWGMGAVPAANTCPLRSPASLPFQQPIRSLKTFWRAKPFAIAAKLVIGTHIKSSYQIRLNYFICSKRITPLKN